MQQQRQKKTAKTKTAVLTIQEGVFPDREFRNLVLSEIDPSLLNHRKTFPAAKMEELRDSIARQGIIAKLTVRPMPGGRFELVTGERRFRAAAMAGLPEVPVIIRHLTDDQVREIQLIENLQREDPDPFEQAGAIRDMMERYHSIPEIAARLRKSKAFVHHRLRLLALIPEICELYRAQVFSLKELQEIAALPAESQKEFFDEYCAHWQDEEFEKPDLSWVLDPYKGDLTKAPFDPKDANLVAEAGPCPKCSFNTAALNTLFPEEATRATCLNLRCFRRKCAAHFAAGLHTIMEREKPQALLFYGSPSDLIKAAIEGRPEIAALPQYFYNSVAIFHEPEAPDLEDWRGEPGGDAGPEFDETGYAYAQSEYETEFAEFDRRLWEGIILKGLLVTEHQQKPLFFTLDQPQTATAAPPRLTAKEIPAALKGGTATPDLLRAEIARLQAREVRSRELDREKVQLTLHGQYTERSKAAADTLPLTGPEWAGAWWLIYQSLDRNTRQEVDASIKPRTLLDILEPSPHFTTNSLN